MILKPAETPGILSAVRKTATFAVFSLWTSGLPLVQSAGFGFVLGDKKPGSSSRAARGKSGKPAFGFPLFPLRSARAVGMWKSRGVCEISKERWERVESLPLAFHGFHRSVISTAPFPHPLRTTFSFIRLAHAPGAALLSFAVIRRRAGPPLRPNAEAPVLPPGIPAEALPWPAACARHTACRWRTAPSSPVPPNSVRV